MKRTNFDGIALLKNFGKFDRSFLLFFFRSNISKFPYRGNRVTFPQKRKHISKCSHEIPARSLHAILNFIACRVFNLNVVSVSCIGNAKLIKSE